MGGEEVSDPAQPESRRDAFKLLQQAGAGVGKEKRPGFFKDSFVDMEVRLHPVPRSLYHTLHEDILGFGASMCGH